jgi:hypothetical protein
MMTPSIQDTYHEDTMTQYTELLATGSGHAFSKEFPDNYEKHNGQLCKLIITGAFT